MSLYASIFTDFNLPNATTWFYFSLLLAVALFFKFTRFFSVRNLDVVTIFLLVPGLLLLQEANGSQALQAARIVAGTGQALAVAGAGLAGATAVTGVVAPVQVGPEQVQWYGYLWLLCGSLYFLIRCVIDLALTRRPALTPNLNPSGLAWLGAALFICLTAVALGKPAGPPGSAVGKQSAAVKEIQRLPEDLLNQEIAAREVTGFNVKFWIECTTAILCHLTIAIGLAFIGWRHFQDAQAGVAAATFYLLLPYTAYHVGQVHHVLPTALLVWAVAAYRRPSVAG